MEIKFRPRRKTACDFIKTNLTLIMASSNLSQGMPGTAAAADPTVDLKTLVTALESLLTLSRSQICTTSPPTEHLSSLTLSGESQSSKAQSFPTKDNQGEPSSLPYVDGALAGVLEAEERRKAWEETESHVRRKLIEIHSKLKNGCIPWDEDESMLLEQDNNPSEKRHRKTSQHEPQNPPLGVGNNHGDQHMQDDEEEGETDEGTVSDPSPSPHLPKAPISANPYLGSTSCKSSAAVGPGYETAEAIVSQSVRILDVTHGFSSETKALAAQLLAELAKTSNGRSLCLHHRTALPTTFRMNEEGDVEDNVIKTVSVVEAVANVLGPDCPLETSVQVIIYER